MPLIAVGFFRVSDGAGFEPCFVLELPARFFPVFFAVFFLLGLFEAPEPCCVPRPLDASLITVLK